MTTAPSSCTVLWSTQSGRAKACARRAARLIRSRGGKIVSGKHRADDDVDSVPGDGGVGHCGCTFDDHGPSDFLSFGARWKDREGGGDTPVLIMFVSTTGDAEQCDTIRSTWSALLRKSLPPETFAGVRFALFALGDRAYGPAAYCAAGRKLAARLVQLGAAPLCDVGYGDDGTPNGGVFADLDGWLEGQLLPLIGGCAEVPSALSGGTAAESPYRIAPLEGKTNGTAAAADDEWRSDAYRSRYDDFFATLCPAAAYRYDSATGRRRKTTDGSGVDARTRDPPMTGRVASNDRITAEEWTQDTRHIRIRVESGDGDAPISGMTVDDDGAVDRANLPYEAGDVATIHPSNSAASVDRLLSVLPAAVRSAADRPIRISPSTPTKSAVPTPWPERCTLRGLLTHCADINALPEREDLRALAAFCNRDHPMGSDHAEKLVGLSETKSAALFGDYVLREKRNWADVLFDFESIGYEGDETGGAADGDGDDDDDRRNGRALLTAEHLLAILPPILPRHFSIASSPTHDALVERGRGEGAGGGFGLDLCVAIVEGTTIRGRPYEGLCSGYLSRLVPSPEDTTKDDGSSSSASLFPAVRVWIRSGSFGRLPLDPSPDNRLRYAAPVLCVGAGTGVAPLRSLVLERDAVRRIRAGETDAGSEGDSADADNTDADDILIFGCRKRAADFYYADDWAGLASAGATGGNHFRLLTAFSRDQKHKLYVQRAAREADGGRLLARHILERRGAVYVAGGAKMARCVKDEITEALAGALVGGERDAKVLLRRMQREGRFAVEAWS